MLVNVQRGGPSTGSPTKPEQADLFQAVYSAHGDVLRPVLAPTTVADTFAMNSVFGWFGCRIRYRDLMIVRASTYLLAILNYHVGQAAIVGYLYRAHKVPFLRATLNCRSVSCWRHSASVFLIFSSLAMTASTAEPLPEHIGPRPRPRNGLE